MAMKLVLYFSVYGTAKAVAEEIARQTGADIMEIEPVVPYDSNRAHYNNLAKLAKKEHDEDQRPAIKNAIPIGDYDTIYLGYPMWWYTFPMIIYTLFEQVDFSGKTLIPFNTHMGSGDRLGYVQLLRRSCLGAFLRKSGQDFQQTHFDHTIISPDSLFGLLSSWLLQKPASSANLE